MRAIIIEEDRFAEVRDAMSNRAKRAHENSFLYQLRERYKITDQDLNMLADEVFRSINYEFVRWAQSHGASCVSR